MDVERKNKLWKINAKEYLIDLERKLIKTIQTTEVNFRVFNPDLKPKKFRKAIRVLIQKINS